MDGYKFEPNNRLDKTGGGIAFYIDEHLSYTIRNEIQLSTCESFFIEIHNKHTKYYHWSNKPPWW